MDQPWWCHLNIINLNLAPYIGFVSGQDQNELVGMFRGCLVRVLNVITHYYTTVERLNFTRLLNVPSLNFFYMKNHHFRIPLCNRKYSETMIVV